MAYYRRLPSGKHNYVVRLPNGKRRSFTDSLKRVAKAQAEEFEAALRRGEGVHLRDRRMTVAQWHAKWVATRNVEAETLTKEASILRRHILPHWESWPLTSINRSDVQAWVTKLTRSGLAGETVGGIYRLFNKLMGDAELDGLIPVTPCRKIELPRRTKPAPRWLTRLEYDRLQMALLGDPDDPDPHGPVWQAMVAAGSFTGMRPGEIAGLDVRHVDFDRQLIRVEQVMTPKRLRPYPKTDSSIRSVPFPDEVGDLLWPVLADRGDDDAAFTMWRGTRIHHSNWTAKVWTPALKRAGIPHVRVYVLRHTAASWMVQAGVPEAEIAEILGHAGKELVSLYAHLAPGAHKSVRAIWAKAGDPQVPHGPVSSSSRWVMRAGESSEIGGSFPL